ncbi:hypothetical protein TWF696_007061 [Orbilia brochopaga]|uniref:Uncharacterized protein n=1 Tax=Orbilia brochopaga TaxID=3140254 RepID=A0AAV9UR57_9PEZI
MNPTMAGNRPAGPIAFSPGQNTHSQPPSTPVSNSNLAAQQQQQLLIQKAHESQMDKSRVTLLLEINAELLRESLNLQSAKAAAAATPDSPEDLKALEKNYNECMHRLKVNLAYLAAMADRRTATLPPSPALLAPPSNLPSLNEPYKRLQALFPNLNGTPQAAHSRGNSQTVLGNPNLKAAMQSQQPQLAHSPQTQQPQPPQASASQHAVSQPQALPPQTPLQPAAVSQNQSGSIAPAMMQNVLQNHIHPGAMANMNHMPQMSQMSPHQQQQLQQIQQIQQQQVLNRQQQQNPQMGMHQQQPSQMNMNPMNFNPGFYLQQAHMQAQMMRPQQNPRMMAVTNAAGMASAGMMAPTLTPSMPGIDPMFGSGDMNWNFGMQGNWGMGGGG